MDLGTTKPLTDMSAWNLPGCKEQPMCKVGWSPLSVSLLSRKWGRLIVS
jgi:hypothetical protein